MKFYYLTVLFLPLVWCAPNFPFYNTSLPWDERVNDLVSRLTLDELQDQLARGYGPAPAIPRLGIRPWQWWTECLNGDVHNNATSFPSTLGLGASFSPDLVGAIAHFIAMEVRAKFTNYSSGGSYELYQGLQCLSPMLNIMRDGRWGRCEETYGEDPFLSGILSKHVVEGLQGDHPRYLLTSSGCKSFDAYAGPETNRLAFDAKISIRDLRTTFLPAFKTCVQAGTYNVMCSYNSINGVPTCVNKEIITDILRNEWGFKGFVISDKAAIEEIIQGHKYINNSIDTAAACLKAGCNLELGPSGNAAGIVYYSIVDAVKMGKVNESLVREMSKPLWYTRMRLGDFDPPSMNPYTQIPLSIVQSDLIRELAELAAMQSFVLLKNTNNFLPIETMFERMAIVGPLANNPQAQISNYSPLVDPRYTTTPLDTLKRLAQYYSYAPGCKDGAVCLDYDESSISTTVEGANIVVVCLGLGNKVEMEAKDRTNISFPGHQLELLKDVVDFSRVSAKILLIMFNAGPVDLRWADSDPKVAGIIEAFYPAQSTGTALYNVIVNNKPIGVSVPAARLPYTWPMSDDQIPPISNYSMEGRTYRYLNTEPLYPFGYGLSYTKFLYSNFTMVDSVKAGGTVSGSLHVKNVGFYDADEVVQVYLKWLDSPVPTPKLNLVSFNRLSFPVNTTNPAFFNISPEQMAVWREDNTGWQIYPGRYQVFAGGQQPDQKKSVGSNVLFGQYTVTGTKFLGKY